MSPRLFEVTNPIGPNPRRTRILLLIVAIAILLLIGSRKVKQALEDAAQSIRRSLRPPIT